MTKTLTEQWREGTIEYGLYYVRVVGRNDITIAHKIEEDLNVKEVLAPVPSHSEYQALKDNCEFTHTRLKGTHQKIAQLEKKLEIAKKALKDCYNDMKYWAVLTRRNQRILSVIKQALKEMEGVK